MRFAKRITLLLVLVSALLAACAGESAFPTAGTTVPIQSAPTQTLPTDPGPVIPGMPGDITVQPLPEHYDASALASPYWEQGINFGGKEHLTYYISIPSIYPFSEDAITCQQEVFELFNNWFGNDLAGLSKEYAGKIRSLAMPEGAFGDPALSNCFSYCAGIHSGILSVLIRRDIWDTPRSNYICFYLDLSTGNRLMAAEASSIYAADKDAVRQAVEAYYLKMHAQVDPSIPFFQENLQKTLSDDNLAKCRLFCTGDGKLAIAAVIYTIGSVETVERLVPLE